MKEITVSELKQKIDNNESFTFLDVRDSFEANISNIDIESVQIPLDNLKEQVEKLDQQSEIVVMCRSGSRSETACELLEEAGFANVANLKGGINEWARKIDPNLPVY